MNYFCFGLQSIVCAFYDSVDGFGWLNRKIQKSDSFGHVPVNLSFVQWSVCLGRQAVCLGVVRTICLETL